MKLATRIIGASLISVVLLTIAAGALMIRNIRLEFELQQRGQGERITQAFTPVLVDRWKSSGTEGVRQFLESESPMSMLGLKVRWVEFSDTPAEEAIPRLPRDQWPTRESPDTTTFIQTDKAGEQQLYTYVPLLVNDQIAGGLEYAASLSQLDRQTQKISLISLGTIGVICIVLIVVAYFTGLVWIGRPLEALMGKADRIGRGDLSGPIELNRDDEMGSLAKSLNLMCQRLLEQRKSIERETTRRIQAIEQLRHADRLKTVGHLAAGVAHELGTPLNVIGGRAELIASGKLSEPQTRESAQAIKSETDHIANIVRQLLTFARLRHPEPTPTDVATVVTHTIDLIQTLAERSHVQVEFRPGTGLTEAMIDAGQIQQVLTNIMMNAIQAMPQGGSIQVEAFPTGDLPTEPQFVVIQIADSGPGMSETTLNQIFDPFFTTKDVGEGTGLGLSIALGIVREHGGRIDVASQPGNGTTFRIFLPAKV